VAGRLGAQTYYVVITREKMRGWLRCLGVTNYSPDSSIFQQLTIAIYVGMGLGSEPKSSTAYLFRARQGAKQQGM